MKFRFKMLLTIVLTLIISISNSRFLFAKEKVDVFEEVFSNNNIEISEYCVTATFKTNLSKTQTWKDVLEKTSTILGDMEYTITDKDEFTNIVFINENYNGTINSTYYGGENIILITVNKKDNKNKTKELQGKLSEILSHVNSIITYSQSIKGKILNNDLDEMNKFVLDTLEKNKSENINTAKLYNGYSNIANTNLYNSKKIGNLDIDIHCAVVKYSSGCYLIMGTPEITLDY
jgi:hypothetical protein